MLSLKKKKHKLKKMLLLCITFCLMAVVCVACHKKNNILKYMSIEMWKPKSNLNQTTVYFVEEGTEELGRVKCQGEYLAYSVYEFEGNVSVYLASKTDYGNAEILYQADDDDAELLDFDVDQEGTLYLWIQKEKHGKSKMYLIKQNKDSKQSEINELHDSNFLRETDYYDLNVSGDGQIVLSSDVGYQVLNQQGEVLKKEAWNENDSNQLIFFNDGIAIVETRENYEPIFYRYDMKIGKSQLLESLSDSLNIITFPDADGYMFVGSEAGLYFYDLQNDIKEFLFKWSDYGITGDDILACFVYEGNLHCITYENSELLDFSNAASESQKKKELIFGIIGDSFQIRQAVSQYNRTATDCVIKVVDYTEGYDMGNDVTVTASNKLYNDILTGKGPDIIAFDPMYVNDALLGKSGVLEDLSGFISASEVVSVDKFVPSVYEALLVDDKLYALPTNFSLRTIVTKKEWIDKSEAWTGDKMLELMECYPEKDVYCQKDYLLENCVILGFDKKEHLDMHQVDNYIQIAGKAEESLVYDPEGDNRTAGNVLFEEDSFDSIENFMYEMVLWGNDAVSVGYPDVAGNGTTILPVNCLAINAKSKNKEKAWDFIEKFFTREWQDKITPNDNFSILQDTLERQLLIRVEDLYKIDPDQSISEEMIQAYTEKLRLLIQGTRVVRRQDSDLVNIILEEAGSVWSGDKTIESANSIIESRVGIMLKER